MTFRSGSTTASPTFAEVVVNNAIQGAGVLLSLVGLALLVAFAAADGGVMDVTASAVFGATLVLLYAISTVNHAIPEHVVPPVLPLLDHIAIYLLIAGTYTPFALIALRGARESPSPREQRRRARASPRRR